MVYNLKSDLTLIPNFVRDYPGAIEEMYLGFPSVLLVPGCSPHPLWILTIHTNFIPITQSLNYLNMR